MCPPNVCNLRWIWPCCREPQQKAKCHYRNIEQENWAERHNVEQLEDLSDCHSNYYYKWFYWCLKASHWSPRVNNIFISASNHYRFLIFTACVVAWRTDLSLFVVRAPLISRCCRVRRTISTTDTSSCVMPWPQTQANADSLGGGAALGWMNYVQLANSSMNSLGHWQRAANHRRSKLRIAHHTKIHIWDGKENAGRGAPRD